jgi:hypothetical protein
MQNETEFHVYLELDLYHFNQNKQHNKNKEEFTLMDFIDKM